LISQIQWKKKYIKPFASLKLAVLVVIAFAVILAKGTFVEADLDAAAAQKLVYNSIWMQIVLGLLAINLTGVMVDRWPWKRHHVGFISAHIGIMVLILGSVITQKFGIDGSMILGIGETSDRIMISNTDLSVNSSYDGIKMANLYRKEVDFYLHPPSPENPIRIPTPSGEIKILDYLPYAYQENKVIEGDPERDGAAVRFQLQNDRVNLSEWMIQPGVSKSAQKSVGPARVILSQDIFIPQKPENLLALRPSSDPKKLYYDIYLARLGKIKSGMISAGDAVDTGWMGLKLRILKYHKSGREEITFKKNNRPTPLTSAAILIEFNGRKQWAPMNSMVKFFTEQAAYFLFYGNREIRAGFNMSLKEFKIGRYQGTVRAASYESVVEMNESGLLPAPSAKSAVDAPAPKTRTISMNEPLDAHGYTFYQASFQADEETGRPQASILSVNRDPGRWIKYFGSLLIVFGICHLFYRKRGVVKRS
jgi:hypothetical protein